MALRWLLEKRAKRLYGERRFWTRMDKVWRLCLTTSGVAFEEGRSTRSCRSCVMLGDEGREKGRVGDERGQCTARRSRGGDPME